MDQAKEVKQPRNVIHFNCIETDPKKLMDCARKSARMWGKHGKH